MTMPAIRSKCRFRLGLGWGLPLLVALSLAAAEAPSSETPAASTRDYSSFRVIAERNIFNASRSGRSGGGPREQRRPVQVDTLSLVGTLIYAKGPVAFFDGSGSSFRGAHRADDKVAGLRITQIQPNSVKLEMGTNLVELKVGMQLRREDQGEWRIASGGERSSAPGTSSSSSSSASGSAASASPSGEVNEVLRRLMEQRQKELQ